MVLKQESSRSWFFFSINLAVRIFMLPTEVDNILDFQLRAAHLMVPFTWDNRHLIDQFVGQTKTSSSLSYLGAWHWKTVCLVSSQETSGRVFSKLQLGNNFATREIKVLTYIVPGETAVDLLCIASVLKKEAPSISELAQTPLKSWKHGKTTRSFAQKYFCASCTQIRGSQYYKWRCQPHTIRNA